MVKVIFIIVSKNEYLRVTFAEEIRGNIIKKKYLEWWLCGSGGGLGLYLEAVALDGLILKTSTPSKRETNCDVYYAIFSRFALQQYFKVAIFPLCLFFLIQTMGWRRGLKRDARLEKKVEKRKICFGCWNRGELSKLWIFSTSFSLHCTERNTVSSYTV